MNDYIAFSAYFGAALTLIIYVVSFRISDRIGHPLANPILICLALLIGALLIFDIDYDAYNQSARYITYLLTPATACLALPLYRQIQKLREYPLAIVAGILTGVAVNALCVLAVALVFRLGHYDFVTLIPKSVTGRRACRWPRSWVVPAALPWRPSPSPVSLGTSWGRRCYGGSM